MDSGTTTGGKEEDTRGGDERTNNVQSTRWCFFRLITLYHPENFPFNPSCAEPDPCSSFLPPASLELSRIPVSLDIVLPSFQRPCPIPGPAGLPAVLHRSYLLRDQPHPSHVLPAPCLAVPIRGSDALGRAGAEEGDEICDRREARISTYFA